MLDAAVRDAETALHTAMGGNSGFERQMRDTCSKTLTGLGRHVKSSADKLHGGELDATRSKLTVLSGAFERKKESVRADTIVELEKKQVSLLAHGHIEAWRMATIRRLQRRTATLRRLHRTTD